jgi:outer membrane receptor for ferrienterochelin and colicin
MSATTGITAQEKNKTISGNVRDAANGEDLIGAAIMVEGTRGGVITNAYGYYSLSLPKGSYKIQVSYLGYATKSIKVDLNGDMKLNVDLEAEAKQIAAVVVSAEGSNANVTKSTMSIEKLSAKTIKSVPALMGEVDVIKAIQLLPGVQSTAEGTSGFSVRGGGYDQNLILLDEAAVYSASHLMGFFSVFNNDALKDVTLYKGDIPASFGGRLSSLLDIRSKDGNNQNYSAAGGIGLISSRLTLEGPLGSDKASAIVAGRRTYADVFLKLSNEQDLQNSSLYFYDMNAKVNYRIDDKNRVFLAGYFGRDKFGMDIAGMSFGNQTLTARWNHLFSPTLFSNFTLIGSAYDYYIRSEWSESMSEELTSGLRDYGLKADFNYMPNNMHNIKFGYNFTYHTFIPGEGGGIGEDNMIARVKFPREYALENAVYVTNETTLGGNLKLKYGLRYTDFANLGKNGGISYRQDQLEPRAGITYILRNNQSVKLSYSRTTQFIQLASNSTSGSPFDLWFQSSKNVKPQKCDQLAAGYFRNLMNDEYELSAEIYYKDMKDVVDFKDHASLMLNPNIEQELRFGRGYSYGLELMIRKNGGRFNGWVSYTLSKSMRRIDSINKNKWYRSPYDKPHNVSTVATYEVSDKLSLSANWVYSTGTPVTYPTGRFRIENSYVPIYSGRNEYRFPDYHRLDLSVTWKLSPPKARFRNELNFSLYNAYGRHNAWAIFFRQDEENPDVSYAEKLYLFSFIPSITWNFNF